MTTSIINTAKLLTPTELTQFNALAKRHGISPADLAELAVKQALYESLHLNDKPKKRKAS